MRALVSDHPRRIAMIVALSLAPFTSARAADGVTIRIGLEASTKLPTEQVEFTAEADAGSTAAFDGRFLRADDLIREQTYRVQVLGDYAAEATFQLSIDGADLGIWQSNFGTSPFAVDGYFDSHEGTVEEKGPKVQMELSSWSMSPATAIFPDGRRLEFDTLVVGVPVGEASTHELGHTLGFRHEHTRPTAYEMTLSLAAPE